jgi:hypothetical protein
MTSLKHFPCELFPSMRWSCSRMAIPVLSTLSARSEGSNANSALPEWESRTMSFNCTGTHYAELGIMDISFSSL